MSKRTPKLSSQFSVLIAILCFFALLLGLALTTTVTAQDTTPQPTSEFDFNVQPTFAVPVETINPQMLPSLTGVNGQAVNADVIIRSGPGQRYRSVGSLAQSGWIDIIGWNGWDEDRECSAQFRRDLDMWVQVQTGERRGWIARCVLDIRGDVTNLPIVDVAGDRDLQR